MYTVGNKVNVEATYVPPSFAHENNKHNRAIKAIKKALLHKAIVKELPGKNSEGYDLVVYFFDNVEPYKVEIKTNNGISKTGYEYPTWLLETFTDHYKQDLPEWRTSSVDTLIIVNMNKSQAHIYDVETLRDYVDKHLYQEVPSGIGTKQYNQSTKLCGWGIKIPWASLEAGCLKTLDLELEPV